MKSISICEVTTNSQYRQSFGFILMNLHYYHATQCFSYDFNA